MHASLYIGSFAAVFPHLPGIVRAGGSDVFVERGGLFTVDRARALCAAVALRPVVDSHVHVILAYDRLMPQAQNALLKVIEDSLHIRWYVIVPRRTALLPTIRSRLTEHAVVLHDENKNEAFDSFFALSYPDRLALIAKEYARVSKTDDEKARVHLWTKEVLMGCEHFAHEDPTGRKQLLDDTLFVREYIDQPGASGKMLLELLALSI